MPYTIIANLAVFVVLVIILLKLSKGEMELSRKVLMGLVGGVVFGFGLQGLYSVKSPAVIISTLEWTNVVANSYISLLYMIIMPLILISMIAAIVRFDLITSLRKVSSSVIAVLLFTTILSSIVAIGVIDIFSLSAVSLVSGDQEVARLVSFESRQARIEGLSISSMLDPFISKNMFSSLADGAGFVFTISVTIFATLFGIAACKFVKENPGHEVAFSKGLDLICGIFMKMVQMIMSLMPYGVMALMARIATSINISDIFYLFKFIAASFVAVGIVFLVHGVFLIVIGFSLKRFFNGVFSVLTIAFKTRSSAACIPLNVEVQIDKLGVPKGIAKVAVSLGASLGQNGCAGIYPTMLALMVAPTIGVEVDFQFLVMLVGIVAITSFIIAGVGGGATFASLIVLSAMGLPIVIVPLLIFIEPLIDMGRTPLNVNGSMTAGVITGRFLNRERA